MELNLSFVSQQVSRVSESQLMVSLYPGLPTTAELFILSDEQMSSEHKKRSEEALDTVRDATCGNFFI